MELRDELERRESRWAAASERYKGKVSAMERESAELKQELKVMEEQRLAHWMKVQIDKQFQLMYADFPFGMHMAGGNHGFTWRACTVCSYHGFVGLPLDCLAVLFEMDCNSLNWTVVLSLLSVPVTLVQHQIHSTETNTLSAWCPHAFILKVTILKSSVKDTCGWHVAEYCT